MNTRNRLNILNLVVFLAMSILIQSNFSLAADIESGQQTQQQKPCCSFKKVACYTIGLAAAGIGGYIGYEKVLKPMLAPETSSPTTTPFTWPTVEPTAAPTGPTASPTSSPTSTPKFLAKKQIRIPGADIEHPIDIDLSKQDGYIYISSKAQNGQPGKISSFNTNEFIGIARDGGPLAITDSGKQYYVNSEGRVNMIEGNEKSTNVFSILSDIQIIDIAG